MIVYNDEDIEKARRVRYSGLSPKANVSVGFVVFNEAEPIGDMRIGVAVMFGEEPDFESFETPFEQRLDVGELLRDVRIDLMSFGPRHGTGSTLGDYACDAAKQCLNETGELELHVLDAESVEVTGMISTTRLSVILSWEELAPHFDIVAR